jgi:hypothetical protein
MGHPTINRSVEVVMPIDAETLDYNETTSELHAALEADLSAKGWPGDSKLLLFNTFAHLDVLISIAEAK